MGKRWGPMKGWEIRWALSLLGGLTVLAAAGPARAEKMQHTLDFSLGYTQQRLRTNGRQLSLGEFQTAPSATENYEYRLQSDTTVRGAELRVDRVFNGPMVGISERFYAASASGLSTPSDASGVRASPGALWGLGFSLETGYISGHWDQVRPFVTARVNLDALQSRIETSQAGQGVLGSADYRTFLLSVDARLGVRVPFDNWLFMDVGANMGLVGNRRYGFEIALGLPIPTANL